MKEQQQFSQAYLEKMGHSEEAKEQMRSLLGNEGNEMNGCTAAKAVGFHNEGYENLISINSD